jgi:glutamate dehydrogenase/leucine dehydrogenase
MKESGTTVDFPGGWHAESIHHVPHDVFLPCALGHSVNESNMEDVKAKLIVEGANAPLTGAAEEYLKSRDVVIVPDILANAGGVIVSYFEWAQNREGFYWEEEVVNERMYQKLATAYKKVKSYADDNRLSLREASYCLALERVAWAVEMRGVQ